MSKKKRQQKGKSSNRKSTQKRRPSTQLKRYNKVVSLLVKDLKKQGVEYDIKTVRKQASSIYPHFKDVAPSKITKKQVVRTVEGFSPIQIGEPKPNEFKINAMNVDQGWVDVAKAWWEICQYVARFMNTYPEVPIVIKSPKNQISLVGYVGEYSGSQLAQFTELLREEFENESGAVFYGTPTKDYVFFGTEGVPFPKRPVFEKVKERTILEVKKREAEYKEKRKKEKLEESLRKRRETIARKKAEKEAQEQEEKDGKTSKKTSKKDTPKTTAPSLADKNKAIELLLEQFKLGLIDKDEFRAEKKSIMDKYGKGGKL